jgi:hypothetical protein
MGKNTLLSVAECQVGVEWSRSDEELMLRWTEVLSIHGGARALASSSRSRPRP